MKKVPIPLILFVAELVFLCGCIQDYSENDETLDNKETNSIDSIIFWESINGPPGGRISNLIQNPNHPNELYATTERSVYKSEDKGENWQLMNGSQDIGVNSIALFEDKLFVCGDGVYYYDNNGNLMRIFDDWCNEVIVSDNKLFININHENIVGPQILYIDLISEDFNWENISPSESELSDLYFPIVPPDDFSYEICIPNIVALDDRILAPIIVNVDGGGEITNGQLYISEDLGATWKTIDFGMDDDIIITNIIQDPEKPEHIFLLFRHNVMHEYTFPVSELIKESYDGGKTWSPITNLTHLTLESNGITDLDIVESVYYLVCPWDNYILMLDGSSYKQMDMPRVNGFGELSFFLDTLIFDFDNPNIVYGKTGNDWSFGLLKSEDKMKTWGKMDEDIIESSPTIIKVHPTDPDIILTSSNIIQESYCTRDAGKTWEPFSTVNSGDEVKIDPHNQNHIILIDELTNIYESNDLGKTFENINQDFSSAKIFDFEIAEDGSEKIFVSNIGVGISEYDHSQEEWRYLTNSPDYSYDIEIDPENSNILYAAYSPKIFENNSSVWKYSKYQEEDFGWSEILKVENSRGITSLEFDKSNPNTIYAGVVGEEGSIYASYDKGETWEELNEDLTFTTIWGHSQLQIDPTDKYTVYVGTWGGGSYKTVDAGNTWMKLDEGHTFSPTCLAISKSDPDIIYACDRTAPTIHKSIDAGETWVEYYHFEGNYMLSSAIAIDPDHPNTIYASAFKFPMAHEGGLVKITDGQATPIGEDLPRSVLEIEIDPNNKNTMYVTTHVHGVYKSEDGGVNWEKLDDKNNGLPRIGFYDIDVDPSDSDILYATGLCGELPSYMLFPGIKNLDPVGICGVYKSNDQGENWEIILETVSEARGIDIDPKNSNNLYVADMMGGVWVSNDAGQNWRQENNGLGSISLTSVKIRENYIYASTQGSGVYAGVIQKDGSIEWNKSRSNKPKVEIAKIQITVDPSDGRRIYASANAGGLLRSDDGGLNWNDKNFLTPSIKVDDPSLQGYYSFDLNPDDPSKVWLTVYEKGVFYSLDGMDYNMIANGLNNEMHGKNLFSVAINPIHPYEIYVAGEEGVFVTRDNGKNWEEMNEGLVTRDVKSLKITNDGELYVGTGGYGVYKFDSETNEWYNLGDTLGGGWWYPWDRRMYQFSSILFDPDIPGKVYYGHFPGGFFISEDNGHTWKDSSLGLGNDGMFSLVMHPYDHNVLFAGTYNGAVKSIDGGKTWEMKSVGMPSEQWPYTVAIDDNNTNIMYVSTKNGQNKGFCDRNDFCGIVMKSIDGGESWFDIMNGLDDGNEFYTLLIYPLDHDILFLSTNYGVYLSKDAGNSWKDINKGLPVLHNQVRENVADNMMLTPDNNYLILGLVEYGVWKADLTEFIGTITNEV